MSTEVMEGLLVVGFSHDESAHTLIVACEFMTHLQHEAMLDLSIE